MPFLPIRNTKLSDNSEWQSTCQTGAVIQQGGRKGQILKAREPMRALLGDLVHSKTRGSNPTLLPPLGGSPLRYSIVSHHLACRWRGLGACDGPVPPVGLLYDINPFSTTAADVCFLKVRREQITHLCCVSCIKSRGCCFKSILCSVCHSSICLFKFFVKF